MTDFAGTFVAGPGRISPIGISSGVAGGSAPSGFPLSLGSLPIAASRGTPQPALTAQVRNIAGMMIETFGGQLFEKVIVIPRLVGLGFVLTSTQFAVEVWNTFREIDQILTAINITGSGGLTIDDVHGEPLLFGALDSFIYQANVPGAGPAAITNDVVFVFLSGVGGADVEVTGSRITVFSVAPEWGEGFKEKISYLTDVLKAYSDNEQRRGLRQLARRGAAYRSLTLTPRNASGMESLVWGWQQQPFGVPWWPDAQALSMDVAISSTTIPVNTADRMYAPGGLLMLWSDEFTFEALTIDTVSGSNVTTTSPTQFSWAAGQGVLVVPLFLGRLAASVKVDRLTSGMDQMDLEFAGEAQQPAPEPSASLTQYKSIDVLEIPPNWANELDRTYKRSLVVMDPKVGPITVDDKGGSAIVSQEFPWWMSSHAQVTAFRAFLLKRFGQLLPFWIPTWDQDLVLASDVGASDPAILIQGVFYSRFFFPVTARRDIAFIPRSGANIYRRITAAQDNGNGTETLTLSSATGVALAAATTMVSFLTLARLGSDDAEINWSGSELAESVLSLQEVPREIPS